MTEMTQTTTIDTAALFDLMTQHSAASESATEAMMDRLFTDPNDPAATLALTERELAFAIEANSLAFEIADMLMTDELKASFLEHYLATAGQDQ